MKWISESWLSCRKYAERASRSIERPLTPLEKFKFILHHYLCFTCRRFRQQILEIEKSLGSYTAAADSERQGPELSAQARERMEAAIRDERSKL